MVASPSPLPIVPNGTAGPVKARSSGGALQALTGPAAPMIQQPATATPEIWNARASATPRHKSASHRSRIDGGSDGDTRFHDPTSLDAQLVDKESEGVRTIRARLEGADATLGRVPAADVARIIINLERAIASAAYLVLGRPRRGTGRHSQAIESAARLRFVGVEHGSLIELLALPEVAEPSDEELPIPVADLSSQAFERLLAAITGDDAEVDAELATVIARMATELGIGDRNTSITLAEDKGWPVKNTTRTATIDGPVRQRMQRLSSRRPRSEDHTLVGVLVEADFEAETARLRLPDGSAITVNFPVDLADEIQEALRSRAQFRGLVQYHPRTSQAIRVDLHALERSTQLPLDIDSFWRVDTFTSLQASQRTTGLVDPDDLAIAELTDDERAAFLAALAE